MNDKGCTSIVYGLVMGVFDGMVLQTVSVVSDYNRSLTVIAVLLLLIIIIRIPLYIPRYSKDSLVAIGSAVFALLLSEIIIINSSMILKFEERLGIPITSTGDGSSGLMILLFISIMTILDLLAIVTGLIRFFKDGHRK